MLPDFPKVKTHISAQLLELLKTRVPQIAPVLAQTSSFHQHEGRRVAYAREDDSTAEVGYEPARFPIELTRDEMRTPDLDGLIAKFEALAQQMAKAQATLMFARISTATEEVGNVVQVGGDFQPHHFLEMIDKVQMDFDPETGLPVGQAFVMHPNIAAKVIPKLRAWEQDPAFKAQYERIMTRKREEWRAREDRRKLVD